MLLLHVCLYLVSCCLCLNGEVRESSSDAFASATDKDSLAVVEKGEVGQEAKKIEMGSSNERETETPFSAMESKAQLSNNTEILQEATAFGSSNRTMAETVSSSSSTESVDTFFSAENNTVDSSEKIGPTSRNSTTSESLKPASEIEVIMPPESNDSDPYESIEDNQGPTQPVVSHNQTTGRNKTLLEMIPAFLQRLLQPLLTGERKNGTSPSRAQGPNGKKDSNSRAWIWSAVKESDYPLGLCPLLRREQKRGDFACTEDKDCQSMKMICCFGLCTQPVPVGPKAHDGSCLAMPIRPVSNATCAHDHDCADDEKCCQSWTEIHCVKPSRLRNFNRKPGFCGNVVPDEMMLQYKLCNGDTDCFMGDKCCPTSTTRRCVPPQHFPSKPKRGKCKLSSPYLLPVTIPLCYDDHDCIGIQKCCYDGWQEKCMNPHSSLEKLD